MFTPAPFLAGRPLDVAWARAPLLFDAREDLFVRSQRVRGLTTAISLALRQAVREARRRGDCGGLGALSCARQDDAQRVRVLLYRVH